MKEIVRNQTDHRAALLAEAVSEVAAELRLLDVGDMITYIRGQKWATIADLVETSTELSFRHGTLLFACMAAFDIDWATPPTVTLEFEFQTSAVSAFFSLSIAARESIVELRDIWFASLPSDDVAGTRVLANALQSARYSKLIGGSL